MLAQEEARRLGHNFVGTEQVRRPPRARPPTRCCSAAHRPDPLSLFPGS